MVNILGTLTDSIGTAVGGTLTFTLLQPVPDDTTTPDTLRLPITYNFTIASDGAVNINVPESETYEVPYRIVFTKTDDSSSLLDFYAIVPNLATVQFWTLTPTGITNASLDTGALRVAQLLTNDPVLSPLVKRPIMKTIHLDGVDTTFKYFLPKATVNGLLVNQIKIFVLSGEAGWTFNVGQTLSTGADTDLPIASTSTVTAVGRTIITQIYNVSVPSSSLALYLLATPGGGSTTLNAFAELAYTETTV